MKKKEMNAAEKKRYDKLVSDIRKLLDPLRKEQANNKKPHMVHNKKTRPAQ